MALTSDQAPLRSLDGSTLLTGKEAIPQRWSRLDIDIAALSEERFAEQGFLGEDRVGYTLFWSGKSKNEHRHSGVCFMIKTSIARKLQNLSVGHSDRIITLRLAVQDKQVCHCLAVCAHLLCRLNLE